MQIQFVSRFFEQHAAAARRLRYLATIESPKGLVNLREIAGSDPRLDGLVVRLCRFLKNYGHWLNSL
jgi:citrate lyase beta subunit